MKTNIFSNNVWTAVCIIFFLGGSIIGAEEASQTTIAKLLQQEILLIINPSEGLIAKNVAMDLNEDDTIQDNEVVTDLNNDGRISPREVLEFAVNNVTSIAQITQIKEAITESTGDVPAVREAMMAEYLPQLALIVQAKVFDELVNLNIAYALAIDEFDSATAILLKEEIDNIENMFKEIDRNRVNLETTKSYLEDADKIFHDIGQFFQCKIAFDCRLAVSKAVSQVNEALISMNYFTGSVEDALNQIIVAAEISFIDYHYILDSQKEKSEKAKDIAKLVKDSAEAQLSSRCKVEMRVGSDNYNFNF